MLRGRHPKKLRAWARWQSGGDPGLGDDALWAGTTTSAYCRDCKAAGGCPPEQCPAPQLLRDAEPGTYAYLVCNTQWNVGGMGQRTGLRYEACLALLDRYLPRWQAEQPAAWAGIAVDDLMQDVQVIEATMLDTWNELAERERNKPPTPGARTLGGR